MKLTEQELQALSTDPHALQALIDWHHVQQTESCSGADTPQSEVKYAEFHNKRIEELEIERAKIAAEWGLDEPTQPPPAPPDLQELAEQLISHLALFDSHRASHSEKVKKVQLYFTEATATLAMENEELRKERDDALAYQIRSAKQHIAAQERVRVLEGELARSNMDLSATVETLFEIMNGDDMRDDQLQDLATGCLFKRVQQKSLLLPYQQQLAQSALTPQDKEKV